MSKGIFETIGGAALIVGGALLEAVPGAQGLASLMILAGVGVVFTGIGTLVSKGPLSGSATTTITPIAPWKIIYGRARRGGSLVDGDEQSDRIDACR